MNTEPSSFYRTLNHLAPATLGVILLLIMFSSHPQAFDLAFNPYALASLVAVMANIALLVRINLPQNRPPSTLPFTLFLTTLVTWGMAEFLERLTSTPESALFWSKLTSFGWIPMPVAFLSFSLIYTKRDNLLKQPAILYSLALPALIFLFLTLSTSAILTNIPEAMIFKPWGYINNFGWLFPFVLAWIELLFIISIGLLISHYRKQQTLMAKRRTLFFIIAILIPLIGGSITDGILPIFDIRPFPVAILLTTVMAALISYATLKYRLFTHNPADVTAEILDTMSEAVLIVDTSQTIEYANKKVLEMTGSTLDSLIGKPLKVIFRGNGTYETVEKKLFNNLSSSHPFQSAEGELGGSLHLSIPVSISASRITNEFGAATGYVLVLTNLSRLKESLRRYQGSSSAFQEEYDRTQTIVSAMGEGLLVVDTNYKITLINPVAERLLGVTSSSAIGKNWAKLVEAYQDNKKIPFEKRTTVEVLKSGKLIRTEPSYNHSYQTSRGHRFPIASVTAPIFRQGKVIAAVKVFRDATQEIRSRESIERQVQERTRDLQHANIKIEKGYMQIQEEKARFLAAINSTSIGFIMTDMEGDLIAVNKAMRDLLGLKHWNVSMADIQKPLKNILDFDHHCRLCAKSKLPLGINEINFKERILRAFFSPIILNAQEQDKKKQEVIGTVIMIEDITESKRLERSKDEFLSIAAHELRTPLTSIRGNTAMLKTMFASSIKDSEIREMVDDIYTSSVRLIELVNDFLNVSRLEQGRIRFNPEPVELKEIIGDVIHEIEQTLKEKKLSFKVMGAANIPPVRADRDRVKQVLINLIGNSLKFTPKGGITVNLTHQDGFVHVAVIDTGRGIEKSYQPLLFTKFEQGGNFYTRDLTQGSGLGLYISKLLVRGMGGKIWLEWSAKNKGSQFVFTLPAAESKLLSKPRQPVYH